MRRRTKKRKEQQKEQKETEADTAHLLKCSICKVVLKPETSGLVEYEVNGVVYHNNAPAFCSSCAELQVRPAWHGWVHGGKRRPK